MTTKALQNGRDARLAVGRGFGQFGRNSAGFNAVSGSTALINIRQFRSTCPGRCPWFCFAYRERAPGERSLRCALVVLKRYAVLLADERRRMAAAAGVASQA